MAQKVFAVNHCLFFTALWLVARALRLGKKARGLEKSGPAMDRLLRPWGGNDTCVLFTEGLVLAGC